MFNMHHTYAHLSTRCSLNSCSTLLSSLVDDQALLALFVGKIDECCTEKDKANDSIIVIIHFLKFVFKYE